MAKHSEDAKPSWFPKLERLDPRTISRDRPVYQTISAAKSFNSRLSDRFQRRYLSSLRVLFPTWQHGVR